jgi:uncharacterized protein YjbJ (UPF0337 family)
MLKNKVQGKFNQIVGKATDDKARELKGYAQETFGNIKDKAAQLTEEIEIDDKSEVSTLLSLTFGLLLLVSGVYFVYRLIDER